MIRTEDSGTATVAIVGGGFCGTMVAVGLLRQPQPVRLNVVMIERGARLGRGLAYGTRCAQHVLNVPAGKMSALPEAPDHFLHWARARDQQITAQSFVPRSLYGEYLADVLDVAHRERNREVRFERVWDRAIGLEAMPDDAGHALRLASSRTRRVDRLVLAVGNLSPVNPAVADPSFYDSPRYVRDPWVPGAGAELAADEPVLFIGTGLTMIDKVLELRAVGHRGPLHALSRHGLLPLTHRLEAVPLPALSLPAHRPEVRSLCSALRAAVSQTAAQGGDWRSVMDALRPHTQDVWQALPLQEKHRFLRHLHAYWDAHRHRLAPCVAAQFDDLLAAGQLQVHAGRLQSFREDEHGVVVVYHPRGGRPPRALRVARVINCTGPSLKVAGCDEPLLIDLQRQGLVRPHPTTLGLDVDARGAVLDAQGRPSAAIYTLGSLRRGQLWETTAVPELRCQAATLAQTLLGGLAASPAVPLLGAVGVGALGPPPLAVAGSDAYRATSRGSP